jgi:N-acetylglucosamine-6-phosphate deacetylase
MILAAPRLRTIKAKHFESGDTFLFSFRGEQLVSREPARGKTDVLYGPPFFDIQCNGFAGIDFNNPDATPEEMAGAVRATWKYGCTAILPTLVTHTPDRLEHLFAKLRAMCALDEQIRRSVPGFHLEGPFISPEEGARGAHPLSAIAPVNRSWWKKWQKAAGNAISMVTVAPEVKGALKFITSLREEHIAPAIGHTMATAEQVRSAADAGAIICTHLGNGCPQMLHRHHNSVIAQAAEDRLAASLITDGIHLPPEMVRTLSRAKGAESTVLTTDAMAAAGAPPGRYRLADLELEVGKDRVVRFPGAPNFAGSALTMDRAVAGYRTMAGTTWADAWKAASVNAWSVYSITGMDLKFLTPEKTFVLARTGEETLEVVATVSEKQLLWSNF